MLKDCKYGKMLFNPKDKYIGEALNAYGEYSESEVDFFKTILTPGMIVMDIGANIGGLTLPLANLVGSTGRVIAIEPQRTIYYQLCANIALNNLHQVICHNAACGNIINEIEVPYMDYDQDYNYGGITLKNKYPVTYKVPLLTIDKLLEEFPMCHFIKIDVEGMEKEVILGAKDTIKKYRPVFYVEFINNQQEIQDLFEELDYKIFPHVATGYNPNNFFNESKNIFNPPKVCSYNIICISKQNCE